MKKNYNNVPAELIAMRIWMPYRLEPRRNGKDAKPPRDARTGYKCDHTNPDNWSDFKTARNAVARFNLDGIGIAITNGLCCIDIDDCVENGVLTDMAKDIINTMGCYCEYSQSKTGVHLIFRAEYEDNDKEYYLNNKRIGVEVYRDVRYLVVTGDIMGRDYL